MLTTDNIRSIGWLNAQSNMINLTPVRNSEMHPVLVLVTREQFDSTDGDIEKMKELAVTVYSES